MSISIQPQSQPQSSQNINLPCLNSEFDNNEFNTDLNSVISSNCNVPQVSTQSQNQNSLPFTLYNQKPPNFDQNYQYHHGVYKPDPYIYTDQSKNPNYYPRYQNFY